MDDTDPEELPSLSLGLADSWHIKVCPSCNESGTLEETDVFGIRECSNCESRYNTLD